MKLRTLLLTASAISGLSSEAYPQATLDSDFVAGRTLGARAADVSNVLDKTGCDPTGATDSSACFNNAAAQLNGVWRSVFVPAGTYQLANNVILNNGQCLYGDSKGNTVITVGSNFSNSAPNVFQLQGTQDSGPCIHDITIMFAQPATDVVSTTTAPSAATTTTITVASNANLINGGSVTDATATTAIPNLTTYTFSGNVVTLSNAIAAPGVGNGDSIHFGPSRATFATLAAGCTTGLGGTGCKYPPAIQLVSNASRSQIYRVKIQAAWDGISTAVNNVMWLDNIEMSALNVGLAWDNTVTNGTKDFSHIHGYHFWTWGMPISSSLLGSNPFQDGNVFAAQIGEVDGINVTDVTTFEARFNLTSHFTFGQFENISEDGQNATFEINGSTSVGIQISNLYTDQFSTGSNTSCQLNMTAGTVNIVNLHQNTSLSVGTCISGGNLTIVGGMEVPSQPGFSSISQTGGNLEVEGILFSANTGAGAWTVPVVVATGSGTTRFIGNTFNTSVGDVGAISIGTDASGNIVDSNNLNGWGFAPPGPLGFYSPSYVSYFTSAGAHSYKLPHGYSGAKISACGWGGAGGSGAVQINSASASGGGGGGGGICDTKIYPASVLSAGTTSTIGTAPTAGAAVTANVSTPTAGNPGVIGGTTYFNATGFGNVMTFPPGGPGAGGQLAGNSGGGGGAAMGSGGGAGTNVAGGTAGNPGGGPGGFGVVGAVQISVNGGSGAGGLNAGAGLAGGNGLGPFNPAGGSSGGGTATGTGQNGGTGARSFANGAVSAIGGTSGTPNGANASTFSLTDVPGPGAAGGYGGATAGNGGAGSQGDGGAGGGSCTVASGPCTSGAGGAAGIAFVEILPLR